MRSFLIDYSALIFLLSISISARAQYRVVAQGSYINSISKTKLSDVGVGLGLERSLLFKRFSLGSGVNYYFPTTINEDVYVYKESNVEDSIKVSVAHSAFMINIPATLKIYVKGKTDGDYNIYILGGAGIWFTPNKSKMSSYDTSVYDSEYAFESEKTVIRLSIDAGVGIERKIAGLFYVFAEARGDLTAGKEKPRTDIADVELPRNLVFNAGIKIPF